MEIIDSQRQNEKIRKNERKTQKIKKYEKHVETEVNCMYMSASYY